MINFQLSPTTTKPPAVNVPSIVSNLLQTTERQNHIDPPRIVVLRFKQLVGRTGLSRATLYNKLSPQSPYYDPVLAQSRLKLSKNAVGFVESGVNQWLQSRLEMNGAVNKGANSAG